MLTKLTRVRFVSELAHTLIESPRPVSESTLVMFFHQPDQKIIGSGGNTSCSFFFCWFILVFLYEDDTPVVFSLLLVHSRDENTTIYCEQFYFFHSTAETPLVTIYRWSKFSCFLTSMLHWLCEFKLFFSPFSGAKKYLAISICLFCYVDSF